MKTIVKLIAPALVLVFMQSTIEAQTVTSSTVFTEGDYASSDISDNRTYVSVCVANVNNDNGIVKTLIKQTNGSFTLVNTYDLLRGSGSSDAVQYPITTISNIDINFVVYKYGWDGDYSRIRLQKNLPDGTSVNILEYTNDGIATMKVLGDDLYCVFGAGSNFDPGTLGGLPNLSGGYYLLKISGTTDQYVWSTFLGNDFVWNDNTEIMEKPGDSDNLYLNRANGDLVKFQRSDGTNLGIVKDGLEGDKYKFDETGNLQRLISSEHILVIYNVNDGYNSILYQTDWAQYNLWGYGMVDWKIINGLLYGVSGERVLNLSNELIHGYIKKISSEIYGPSIRKKYVNYDATFTYITDDSGIIHIKTFTQEGEDTSLIPTINDNEPDIVAAINGQTYSETEWVDAYHQGTLVFADGTLPSIGDTPNANWVNVPAGTHLLGFNNIEENLRPEGGLIFRMGVRKDGTASDDINLKVILKEESDVVLDNYTISIEKTSDGAEPNSNIVFTVNISPVNNSGTAITGDIIYSGTATEDVDYISIGSFSIPDGSSSAIINLTVQDDSEYEGTETVIATISNLSNGNIGTSGATANIVDDETSGIESIESGVYLYPNPAQDILNISCNFAVERIAVCDIAGRDISGIHPMTQSHRMNSNTNSSINISHLIPGIYFLKITTKSGIVFKRFVKK